MRYPPAVALINAVVKGRDASSGHQDAGDLVAALSAAGEPFRVLGPAPAPLSRLKGEHRAQFFIKGTHRARRCARRCCARSTPPGADIKRRTIVDVDPMSVSVSGLEFTLARLGLSIRMTSVALISSSQLSNPRRRIAYRRYLLRPLRAPT